MGDNRIGLKSHTEIILKGHTKIILLNKNRMVGKPREMIGWKKSNNYIILMNKTKMIGIGNGRKILIGRNEPFLQGASVPNLMRYGEYSLKRRNLEASAELVVSYF